MAAAEAVALARAAAVAGSKVAAVAIKAAVAAATAAIAEAVAAADAGKRLNLVMMSLEFPGASFFCAAGPSHFAAPWVWEGETTDLLISLFSEG